MVPPKKTARCSMHLSDPFRFVFNQFREGAKISLDAQIEREIQRGLAGEDKSIERLEQLIDQRARLVREIAGAS